MMTARARALRAACVLVTVVSAAAVCLWWPSAAPDVSRDALHATFDGKGGHDFWQRIRTDENRRALIEYLKTL